MTTDITTDVWRDVVGQDHAIAQLTAAAVNPVHAYLLVGPSGSGKRAAARAFAALLLSDGAEGTAAERHLQLALAEAHPDLLVVEPTTAQGRIDATAAREIVQRAARSPAEGARKVLVLEDFHLIDRFGAILLKYVEEPPASTFFVILAEDVPPELVTIASRSVRIDLGPVPVAAVIARLVAEGVDAEEAPAVAAAAAGDLDRARLLATDQRFAVRATALAALPHRLDGTGTRAAELAAEVKALIDDAQDVIDARHVAEGALLQERIERYGQRGSGKKDAEDRQKREVRRHRTAELRFALATFAGVYRDALVTARNPVAVVDGLHRIDRAALSLERFPNEALLLQSLLSQLPSLPA
ncbi:MAG: ATP-binding protein [Acidimicrobiales bacterium]|nr:ATP-binding protein [Acidimicrobiales bacterium]